MTILGAEHGFLEVEPHDRAKRRADREVVLLLHGLGGGKDDWRFPDWRDYHWDLAHDPPDRHDDNNLTPPLDHLPEFGLSPMRTNLRCWSGVLKALGHTIVNYSQDGPQSVVDVPLAQFEQRIVPSVRSDVLTGNLAGKRVIVLCHSRGGILIRAYLHRHPDDGREWIGRVVTLCSPHQGTLAPVAKQKLVDAATALGLPGFGPGLLLFNLVGRIAGWFDESSGAVQLLPDDSLFAELVAPADVPDIEFATFGGTSVRFTRVYSWHYTPGSDAPNWSDFPDLRFDWTRVAIEVPGASPTPDQLPDFAVDAEQDNGRGTDWSPMPGPGCPGGAARADSGSTTPRRSGTRACLSGWPNVAEELGLAGQQRDDRGEAEHEDADPRRAEARVQAAQRVGHLAVDAHRVDEPRDADQRRVRGDEQDRRGEQADVQLARRLQRPEIDLLDDTEDRVAGVASLVLGEAEQRLVLAGLRVALDRQRRQRDGRQREVDRVDGDPHAVDRLRDRPALVLGLLGHVRDRLDAGVGDHADRDRQDEVRPRRRLADVDVVDERFR